MAMLILVKTEGTGVPVVGWSLVSPSYDTVSWSPSTGGFFETSATFSQTGDRIYVTDVDGSVYQYTTTAFSLSSPVAAGSSANLYDPGGGFGGGDMLPDCVEFKTDGTRMFVGSNWDGNGAAYIHEYTLATAWDVSSVLTYVGSYQIPGAFEGKFGMHFQPAGNKVFIATTATGAASSNPRILEIGLGTNWSIAGSNTLNDTQVVSSVDPFDCSDVYIDPTGTKLWWTGQSTNKMHEESLGTAWDLTTFSFTPAYELDTSTQTTPGAMVWKHDDGTKAYVFGGGTLYQYTTEE